MNKPPKYLVAIVVMFLILFGQYLIAQGSGEALNLLSGAAVIDITPERPVQLAGYGNCKELSEGVHDQLYARAVMFKKGDKTLVLVSTDLLGFYNNTY